MGTYLRKFIDKFPDREWEIAKLCRDLPVFRSIREEKDIAEAAKAGWKELPECASEYQKILDRLEHESLDYLSRVNA